MTPFEQTVMTLVFMGAAYFWGRLNGINGGIEITIETLMNHGFLTQDDIAKLETLKRKLDDNE